MSSFGDPSYGITRRLPGANFADVVEQVRARLGEQGFGVLTEIDVKATMKKKLDLDYDDYLILGACAPPFAHKALSLERSIGLLLRRLQAGKDATLAGVVARVDDDGSWTFRREPPRLVQGPF